MAAAAPGSIDGLICALELDGQGGARDISTGSLGSPSGNPEWLHFDFTAAGSRTWLRERSGIDSFIVAALLDEDSRPRVVKHDNGVLLILRGVNTNPGANPEDMVSIRLWIQKNRIVSTRRRRLLSVVELREALQAGEGPHNIAGFLLTLINKLETRITPAVDGLDDEIEAAEEAFASAETFPYSGEFSSLRRQAARIRRYLAPQREALDRLSRDAEELLTAEEALTVREEADQITRHLEDLDLVRERAILAQEELLGRLANEQNRRMYVLSLVAAIFLPLSFLTGLMGMNVAGMPGAEDSGAFLLVSGLMVAIAAVIVVVFKWQKWL